ncbi:sensor histidine kinase [Demequina sp.]|uniref:sensor histidine kinase n=1 Tax=Demequina sp. TaxID=2050685 RepID=UPI003D0EC902
MSSLRSFVSALWSGRTWKALAYLLVGLLAGVLWLSWSVTMYVTGAALVIVWIGIPILVFTQLSMRWIGAAERWQANRLLGMRIGKPEPVAPRPGADGARGVWKRTFYWGGARMHDTHAWRVFAWTVIRGVLGPIGFVVAVVAFVVPVAVLTQAMVYVLSEIGVFDISWQGEPFYGEAPWWWCPWLLLLVPLGFILAVGAAWLVRGFAAVHEPIARWALGPCREEATRRATERAQLAEERVRIDQDLHDSIGHMITMTVIQAGAGAHVFDTDPEFARQALRTIEERGRAAMGELDRIIATMRGASDHELAPLPGVEALPGLIEDSRSAGLDIRATIDAGGANGAVSRAVFSIVRESLTNAAKHAPGAPVEVTVAPDGDAIGVLVRNPRGTARAARAESTASLGRGSGLAGLRDRATLLGGTLLAGEGPGGTFEVLALLPIGTALSEDGAPDSPWAPLRERLSA